MRVYYGKKGKYVQGEFTGWKDQLFMGLCAVLERERTTAYLSVQHLSENTIAQLDAIHPLPQQFGSTSDN